MEAVNISYTKHFGSIALGSLIHTVLGFFRIIVETFENSVRSENGGSNIGLIIVACCLSCIVSAIS
jgi:hypothetical protein